MHINPRSRVLTASSQVKRPSTEWLIKAFRFGFVSKDDLASALRAHHTATVRSVDATKSPQKKAAEDQLEIDDCRGCLVVPNIILF